ASVLIDPSGQKKIVYRKIHLFDVNVQGRVVRESDSFCAGSEEAIVDIKGWRVGLTICYDLRFAELFVKYHKQQVDLVLVPSSFLVPTGRSHWQTLLRARAIETQSYVAAPAQVGVHKSVVAPSLSERQTWGESLVVGPWGEILAASSSFDQPLSLKPILLELDKEQLQKVRAQIPLLQHRRL
ncbi:carbon-nitrogen hydrolase family protein, partial [bacterium]|nr:carbon-nitrogen hydrolase family protein [bacterium]